MTKKQIESVIASDNAGMSFEHRIVVAEECQNFTQEEMETMLTRLGEGCAIIFTGDTRQHDLKGQTMNDECGCTTIAVLTGCFLINIIVLAFIGLTKP